MSDGELRPGVAIFLRSFTDHPSDTVQLKFPAPKEKGRTHLAIWLGTWVEGEETADKRLNALGWVYDPKAAERACGSPRSMTPRRISPNERN